MTPVTALQEHLEQVRAQIAATCASAGRQPDEITLVAVSKTQSAAAVLNAARLGLSDFGENRVEEAVTKIDAVAVQVPDGVTVRWHMIGHIQSRKARLVVSRFCLTHSVDSVKLAGKLSRLAEEAGITQDILLEMNVSGEATKYGWQAVDWNQSPAKRESLWSDIRSILKMPGLRVQGIMTMAPFVSDPELARPIFANLRRLRDALRSDFAEVAWPHLSMGMSNDYQVAISEGATIVRIGQAIFGPRHVQ